MKRVSPLRIGEIEIFWLEGGDFRLDGGTMFGAVPKILWRQRYPVDEGNCIPMCNDPLLVRTRDALAVIDTGLGNTLSEKQNKIFHVSSSWDLPGQLEQLGMSRMDVDLVILTHCDFDHAGGIEMINAAGERELTFPRAMHIIQEMEWQDLSSPCDRAMTTYLEENFVQLRNFGRLQLVTGEKEVCAGVRVRHTGGHTRGHQLIEISSQGQTVVHFGDLCPTHAHVNPLWIMAYDNFPLEAIERKKTLFQQYLMKKSWFSFYHDPFFRAVQLNDEFRLAACLPAPAEKRGKAAIGCGPLPETITSC